MINTHTIMIFFGRDISQRRLGMTLAFGSLLWSGTYNALAKGLTPYLSPISLLLISEALTALFIVLTYGIVPLFKKFLRLDAKTIRIAAGVGLLNSAIAPLLWFSGLARTSAINASMLSSAEILCVIVLSAFILHERITRMQMIGAGTVLLGVLIINLTSVDVALSVHIGDALILAGAFASGTGAVLFKRHLSHVMPELAVLIRNITGIVAVSILAFFIQHSLAQEVADFPMTKVLLLIAFTFFSRYLNITFYYEALDRLEATTVALIGIATPFSGLVFAYLILGESIHSYQILGGIFILFGLMLEQVSTQTLSRLRRPFWIGLHVGHLHHDPTPSDHSLGILTKNV